MSSVDSPPTITKQPKEEKTIPVAGQRESISKNIITREFKIEKRWMTTTVQVPIKYEEIFVNGKRYGSQAGFESFLQSIRGIGKTKEDKVNQRKKLLNDKQDKVKSTGKSVPLTESSSVLEKVLPLYAEKITVKRHMTKYAEAVIRKKQLTQTTKTKVQLKGEKVTVRYPDGTERTLESTSQAPEMAEAA